MTRRKPIPLHHRLRNIYCSQQRRAKKYGTKLDYTAVDLNKKVAQVCGYCGEALATSDLSFDHGQPLSRGGSFSLDNLIACHLRCNLAKAVLTVDEFCQLLDLLDDWPQEAKTNVLARLKAGGGLMNGWRPRSRRRRK